MLWRCTFYFMPFIIGYAAAKRFKVKEIFGIMTAGILMYSTFLSPKEGITGYAFGPINIPAYNYKGSIFRLFCRCGSSPSFSISSTSICPKSAHRLSGVAVLPDFLHSLFLGLPLPRWATGSPRV